VELLKLEHLKKNKETFLCPYVSFLSWTNLNRRILTSPCQSSSSKNLSIRDYCLGPRLASVQGGELRAACSQGSDQREAFSRLLLSPPSEAGGGMGKSQFLFNASFYSAPFENSLCPTLPPTLYPKILMPEKESKF
jgi:hypothetical protein